MTEEGLATGTPDGAHGIPDSGYGIPDSGGDAVTGDARVDEAVTRLGDLADAPLDEHPLILGQIHDRLREVLGELGSAPPNGPGSPSPNGPGSPGAP